MAPGQLHIVYPQHVLYELFEFRAFVGIENVGFFYNGRLISAVGSVCMFRYCFLKQGDVLKLHVTTKYLSWRKRKIMKCGDDGRKVEVWFPLRPPCNIGEITHCQSMKG